MPNYTTQNIGYNPNWTERQRVEPTLASSSAGGWPAGYYQSNYPTVMDPATAAYGVAGAYGPTGVSNYSLPSLPSGNDTKSVQTSKVYEDPAYVSGAYNYMSPEQSQQAKMLESGNAWDPAYYNPMGQAIGAIPAMSQKQVASLVSKVNNALSSGIDAPVYSRQSSGGLPSGYSYAGGNLAIDPNGNYVDLGSISGGGRMSSAPAMAYSASPARYDPTSIQAGGGLPSGYVNAGGGLVMTPDGRMVDAGSVPGGSSSGGSTGGSMCYLTTAAVEGHEDDDGPTLSALRWFRDAIMGGKHAEDVTEYYRTAPGVVAWIEVHPKRDRIYRLIRTCILRRCLRHIERFEFDKCRRLYRRMVKFLEARANG